MKKQITLLSGLMLFAGLSYGQLANVKSRGAEEVPHVFYKNASNFLQAPIKGSNSVAKAVGERVWFDDFSDESTWMIDNNGQSAANHGWSITTVGTGWTNVAALNAALNSTSGGKYAKLGNGTNTANAQSVIYTLTTATPINLQDLAGTNQVNLRFMQTGALFNDAQTVQVSTDGLNYTEVYTNAGRTVYNGTNPTAIYANPEVITVDLSDVIDATALSTVYIRFRWTSRIPSNTTANAWTTFGWKIDDVEIVKKNDNDIAVTSSYWGQQGVKYFQIPVNQVDTIKFSANVKNAGGNPLKNAKLNVSVNGSALATTGSATTIAVNGADSLYSEGYAIPATVGTYNVTRSIVHDSIDDAPVNNQLTDFSFKVTDYIFARDNGTNDGYTFTNENAGYEVGTYYEVVQPTTVYGVDVVLHNSSTVGSEFLGMLYTDTGMGSTYQEYFSLKQETTIKTYAASMAGQTVTLLFDPPVQMVPSEVYYLVFSSLDGNVNITTGGTSDNIAYLYDGTFRLQSLTPSVRLNFDPSVAIKNASDIVSGVTMFPNPATDKVAVNFNLATSSDVVIEIADINGKVMSTKNLTNAAAGSNNVEFNTANFAAGLYTVNIKSDNANVTNKLIIK